VTRRPKAVTAAVISHTGRLYATAFALVVFFLSWSVIAARPWVSPALDPRLAVLAARERQLRRESIVVRRIVEHRWAAYRAALHVRNAQIAAAKQQQLQQQAQLAAAPAAGPAVQVVSLPPLTITRTS
jgi:hypothetical protein